jgi:hypothetical protein
VSRTLRTHPHIAWHPPRLYIQLQRCCRACQNFCAIHSCVTSSSNSTESCCNRGQFCQQQHTPPSQPIHAVQLQLCKLAETSRKSILRQHTQEPEDCAQLTPRRQHCHDDSTTSAVWPAFDARCTQTRQEPEQSQSRQLRAIIHRLGVCCRCTAHA